MASQIQHLEAWGIKDPLDPIHNLLVPWGSPSPALTYLEVVFSHLTPSLPSILLLNTLWLYVRHILNIRGYCPYTPLWHYSNFKELLKLQGFQDWERMGITYITQLYIGSVLKSFADLQSESAFSESILYVPTNQTHMTDSYHCASSS